MDTFIILNTYDFIIGAFRRSSQDVLCKITVLYLTSKKIAKYFWMCSFFSKGAGRRPGTVPKWTPSHKSGLEQLHSRIPV